MRGAGAAAAARQARQSELALGFTLLIPRTTRPVCSPSLSIRSVSLSWHERDQDLTGVPRLGFVLPRTCTLVMLRLPTAAPLSPTGAGVPVDLRRSGVPPQGAGGGLQGGDWRAADRLPHLQAPRQPRSGARRLHDDDIETACSTQQLCFTYPCLRACRRAMSAPHVAGHEYTTNHVVAGSAWSSIVTMCRAQQELSYGSNPAGRHACLLHAP